MSTTRNFRRTLLLTAVGLTAAALISMPAPRAAGPLAIFQTGQPYLWPAGGTLIPFNPDQGGLGPLSNAAAVADTTAAFQTWENVASSTVSYVNGGLLPLDVDSTNFFPFVSPAAPDGLNAIVYDQNGAIFSILFGSGSGVLGFSGPEWVNTITGDILEGVAVLNGGAILGGFTEFFAVQVHEFGHYTNLAHTVVNGQIAVTGDQSGPTPNNTFPVPTLFNRIETMYPFLLVGGGQATLHPDDVASVSTLYPEPDFFSTTGTITGTILAADGTTRLSGVNVIARNTANPLDDAVSAISGDFTDDFSQANLLAGVYTLNGLTPGANYAIYVDQILAGGFSTPPLRPLPNVEEFYNGANESSDPRTDDPAVFSPVAAVAGLPATGIDIIFNDFAPGVPLPMGEDSSIQLFLPFEFKFCGTDHGSVFVNANGSLSFGIGNSDFSESSAEMLSGPPRIAGLWDDLSPNAGGTVIFTQTANRFTVSFTDVPTFPATGANTFSMELRRSSDQVKLTYGGLSSPHGVAGFSCGGLVTNGLEPETDLSGFGPSTINGRLKTALYENFDLADGDLAGTTVKFTVPKKQFKDKDEPNDDFTHATPVTLPFNSASRFTTIRCDDDSSDSDDSDSGDSDSDSAHGGGGKVCLGPDQDADFFIFQAEAGTTLLAETKPGNPRDTVIGLFSVAEVFAANFTGNNATFAGPGIRRAGLGAGGVETGPVALAPTSRGRSAAAPTEGLRRGRSGLRSDRAQHALMLQELTMHQLVTETLLATDDDGGVGLLSRLVFPITESGFYAVAVSTFPDLNFTGAGGSSGRYVLELQVIDGVLLNLGDDNSRRVNLTSFTFPFQGSNWSSVFVNANGNLTFGVGDSDFNETAGELLSGPPRIAPLWDDLSPNKGGMVVAKQTATSLKVSYIEVPEFLATGTNTFAVTLAADGTVTIDYGATNSNDGIVGVSQGGGAADPGETDLSAAASLSAVGTTYEQFFTGELDLDNLVLVFSNP